MGTHRTSSIEEGANSGNIQSPLSSHIQMNSIHSWSKSSLFLLVGLLLPYTSNAESSLSFQIAGKTEREIPLSQLVAKDSGSAIDVTTDFLTGTYQYQALPLHQVLQEGFGNTWQSKDYSHVAFIALDDYEAISSLELLQQDGGYIAYKDLNASEGWTPVGIRNADPGPFFLVWTKEHQTTQNAFPWPWQLAKINLLTFETQYPNIHPGGVDSASAVNKGFEIFRDRCLRCHAMNRQGGKIGPDLNAPQNITAYRSENMIKAFVKNPATFRYSKMPSHLDLDDQALDNLYRYFIHQRYRDQSQ